MAKSRDPKQIETFTHDDATRKNIPTAEYQSMVEKSDKEAIRVAYERRVAGQHNGPLFLN